MTICVCLDVCTRGGGPGECAGRGTVAARGDLGGDGPCRRSMMHVARLCIYTSDHSHRGRSGAAVRVCTSHSHPWFWVFFTRPKAARGPSKRPCRLVCFCVLCVRPRSLAPASNTKPFGVIMVYLREDEFCMDCTWTRPALPLQPKPTRVCAGAWLAHRPSAREDELGKADAQGKSIT